MQETVIRPSMKFIKAGYVCVIILILVAVAVHYQFLVPREQPPWLPGIAALFILWPIKRHIQRMAVKVTLSGDKLHYETGLISKSTRIIVLSKIQDVRVAQTVGQRMFNVGDISIETAGEYSRLVVPNLDNPRQLAEQLTDASGGAVQKI
jgi:uncharacterized membrane protein YdbT with pleckstrin-like domain